MAWWHCMWSVCYALYVVYGIVIHSGFYMSFFCIHVNVNIQLFINLPLLQFKLKWKLRVSIAFYKRQHARMLSEKDSNMEAKTEFISSSKHSNFDQCAASNNISPIAFLPHTTRIAYYYIHPPAARPAQASVVQSFSFVTTFRCCLGCL